MFISWDKDKMLRSACLFEVLTKLFSSVCVMNPVRESLVSRMAAAKHAGEED